MFGSDDLEGFWESGLPGIIAGGILVIWFILWVLKRWFR